MPFGYAFGASALFIFVVSLFLSSSNIIFISFTMASQPAAPHSDYCQEYLPPAIVEKLEAGAFQSLCQHLQERSDDVANMDLMTLSGFCRNCLAKVIYVQCVSLSLIITV
jgi:hypothetical protein